MKNFDQVFRLAKKMSCYIFALFSTEILVVILWFFYVVLLLTLQSQLLTSMTLNLRTGMIVNGRHLIYRGS